MENNLGRVGVIGRFKPLHNGAAALLESLCENAQQVIIGIGSSNKYNERNPFTARETADMINAFLGKRFENYKIIKVPDFAQVPGCEDGQKWRKFVLEKFGDLDYFVSRNDFVRSLFKENYNLLYPGDVVPKEKHVLLRATRVRYEMATYQNWQELVPRAVAEYLEKRGLADRFRKEFGLLTIASVAEKNDYNRTESAVQEMLHAQER